jgi:hypothetical protein
MLQRLDPRGIVSEISSHVLFSFCFQMLLKLLFSYMYKCRSRTGSNQSEPISIKFPTAGNETNVHVKVTNTSKNKKCADKSPMVPLDSPAMGTRSKKWQPSSPAMSTRSKRRLSLWFSYNGHEGSILLCWSCDVFADLTLRDTFELVLMYAEICTHLLVVPMHFVYMHPSVNCSDAFCMYIYIYVWIVWDMASKKRGGSVQFFYFSESRSVNKILQVRGTKVFARLSLTPLEQKMY